MRIASDSKLSIHQSTGAPEVWLYQRDRIQIKHLENGVYINAPASRAFPSVSAILAIELELRRTGTDLTVVRAVRQFCRKFLQI